MPDEIRTRIDSHRLMRTTREEQANERVVFSREEIERRKKEEGKMWKRRAKIHIVLFLVSFLFTLGVFTLGVLLFVRPGELFLLVLVSIFSGAVFVATFTVLRMFVLHVVLPKPQNKEDDPGVQHHLAKSIAYGFVALVFAIVLAGIIVNIVSASII